MTTARPNGVITALKSVKSASKLNASRSLSDSPHRRLSYRTTVTPLEKLSQNRLAKRSSRIFDKLVTQADGQPNRYGPAIEKINTDCIVGEMYIANSIT